MQARKAGITYCDETLQGVRLCQNCIECDVIQRDKNKKKSQDLQDEFIGFSFRFVR